MMKKIYAYRDAIPHKHDKSISNYYLKQAF